MCFNTESDWTAEIYEVTDGANNEACRCDECGRHISRLDWCRKIYGQEREICEHCDRKIDDEPTVDDCEDGCNFGESWNYVCCEPCSKVLEAIKAVELENGCDLRESQPALNELVLTMQRDRIEGCKYAARALRDHPELATHVNALAAG